MHASQQLRGDKQMQLKSETLAKRCEICHQADCFDPQTNYCSRCAGIPTTVPSRYSNSTSFLDAVNDSRFVQTFGIISLIGAVIFFLGKAVGLGIGLTVLLYGRNQFYKILGIFGIILSLVISPIVNFWMLSTAIVVKGYDILKVLRVEGFSDPDWQPTRKRVLTGMVTGIISFLLSTCIIGVSLLGFAIERYQRNYDYDPQGYQRQSSQNYQYGHQSQEYQYTGDIETQLFKAISNHDTKKVARLVEIKQLNVNAKNTSGVTVLMYASQLGYSDIVEILCIAGANPNLQDINGGSALMYAAMNSNTITAQILLKYGANLKLKNKNGATAIDYAKERKNTEIIEMFKENESQQ
jgi:hypothetical protein